MKLTPKKTNRGWELADETGTFECEEISVVYATRKAAKVAADAANYGHESFDEYRAMKAKAE